MKPRRIQEFTVEDERCAAKDRNEEYKKTKEITTNLWMDAAIDRQRMHSEGRLKNEDRRVDGMDADEILRTMHACDELIGELRRRHWMGSLCKQVYEAKYSLSGQTKDFRSWL